MENQILVYCNDCYLCFAIQTKDYECNRKCAQNIIFNLSVFRDTYKLLLNVYGKTFSVS